MMQQTCALYDGIYQVSLSALRLKPLTLAQCKKWLPWSVITHHRAREASIWFGQSSWFISISFSSALFVSALRYILLCSLSITQRSQKIEEERQVSQKRNHREHPAFYSLLLHTYLLLLNLLTGTAVCFNDIFLKGLIILDFICCGEGVCVCFSKRYEYHAVTSAATLWLFLLRQVGCQLYVCVRVCSSTIKRVTQIISWHGHFLCLNSSVFIFMLFFMAAHISLHLCWWLTNHLSRWRFLPCLAHVTTSICLQVFLYFLKRMFLNSTLRWAGNRWHVGITKCIFFFFITGFSWLKTCPMKIWRSVTGARWVWSLLFAPNCVCDSSPVNCILL